MDSVHCKPVRQAGVHGESVHCFVLLLVLAFFSAVGHADKTVPSASIEPVWTLVSEKDDIKVYTQHREGSRLKAFRGVMAMPVRDWSALAGVINDYANMPRWIFFVSAAQELGRRGPLERDLIFQTGLPWPVSDREAVVTVKSWNPPGTYDTVIRISNAPGLLPPNGDFVRFPELNARFDFRWLGGNRAEVTYELSVDPGGYIPGWIVHIMLRDAPYFTLRDFARAIERPEYQGKYYDYIVTPPGYPRTNAVMK